MKSNKFKIFIFTTIIIVLTIRFFCGVFEQDEFGEDVYFIKHKPNWKWRFYSPRGMGDLELNQMTVEQKNEQVMFDEFVSKRISR
jgi:hypothetical protein